ncbi:class II fructose-bisphosphate aldolase [Aestuariivirga sp.]|uniref:class II fructose-bisphosphate aldolase n=1 Tax=Aestuariivirga sp. TaxID=2650926 RepID=UPI0035935A88
MTAAPLTEVLDWATRQRCAVAGLVVLGWEDARAFVEAADVTGLPVILQAGPGCRRYMPVQVLGKMFRHLADETRVPVVCHIDHAYTVEECAAGIEHGFTSVMIDGSALEIGANIEITARVAEIARRAGVSVEGEVGVVGYANGRPSAVTSPADAHRFAAESGADALAISVGNVHLQTEKSDGIDFEALRHVEAVTRLPLVLHGGSGIPPHVRQRLARETGVKKFNIGTELRMAFGAALRTSLATHHGVFDRNQLLAPTIPVLREAACGLLRELGPEAAGTEQ